MNDMKTWQAVEIQPEDPELDAWEVRSGDDAVATAVIGRENAALMAAAPGLLRALEEALRWEDDLDDFEMPEPDFDAWQALIAKARGQGG